MNNKLMLVYDDNVNIKHTYEEADSLMKSFNTNLIKLINEFQYRDLDKSEEVKYSIIYTMKIVNGKYEIKKIK